MILILLQIMLPPFMRKWLLKTFYGANIGRHVKWSWFSIISAKNIILHDYCEIRPLTIIRLSGSIEIGAYSIISIMNLIYGSASVSIGRHSYIGPQSLINADENISIGNHSALGARSVLFTHGSFFPYHKGYWVKCAPITIGDNSWLAGGTFIHPGITIAEHVFANSCSVITADVAANAVVAGHPAKPLANLRRTKRNMNPQRLASAMQDVISSFCEKVLENNTRVNLHKPNGSLASFDFNSSNYQIKLINNINDHNADGQSADKSIIFINDESSAIPRYPDSVNWFNLASMKTNYSNDTIHQELYDFMKKYYGMRFEFYE